MNRLGEFIHKYRTVVLIIWLLIIIGFGFFALKLPSVLSGNGFEYKGAYKETREILEKDFNNPKSSIILVFERDKTVSDKQWRYYIEKTFHKLEGFDRAEKIISPLDREGMMKNSYAYGLINFSKDAGSLGKEIKSLDNRLANGKGLKVTMTGEPIILKDLNEASQKDLTKAEMIGLPIALVVLLLAFGSLVAAGIPIVIGIVSILTTMGIVYFFSYTSDLSIFILNIIPMIGLALSIDFALLFINRYKEELTKGTVADAVKTTVATAGRSIIFSGMCVFIGLAGLLFIKIDIFQNVALGGMIVVFVSALSAITFLPALLSLLGNRINKLSLLRVKDKKSTVWYRFAHFVMKKPVLMIIGALFILLSGLTPIKNMVLAIPGTDSLPPGYPSRVAIETFREEFVPKDKRDEKKVEIIFETKGKITDKGNLVKTKKAINKLQKDSLVSAVESPYSVSGINDPEQLSQMLSSNQGRQRLAPVMNAFIKDNKMLVNVYLKTGQHSSKARAWIREWSDKDLGVKAHFGGQIKFEQEIFDEIYQKAPYGLILILLSTLVILMIAFRSILIPIKAIVMNVLSLGSTFGIVVWIYQLGHFGMKPTDIALILPVFVFSLVFGLSMDYEVFLISRIQEYYLETGDNSRATVEGLTSTSKIITSAAAIMIVVTGAFAFTGVMPVKQLGVGIAIAIFIDATIVRLILVPALMKLLGDWNWWFFGFTNKKTMKH
ncbi:MMPL family transporter [Neobacillus terrae]|uniref:MMPL family transporter n=1 Tax=Neobacillus terrae TaxID=3034837 RepID=UPI00140E8932|nr:MMPL family transporter [Neobacillus terrae]